MRLPSEKAIGALIAFNALACEEAERPECVCACGGKMHGQKHPREWVKATTAKVALEMHGATQTELDLGGAAARIVVREGAEGVPDGRGTFSRYRRPRARRTPRD